MKNIKTLGLAVLLSCLSLSAQAKPVVTIADVYAQPNSKTYFTINLKVDEDKADTYMSFDAEVTLPEGFTPPAMVGEEANNLTVWKGAIPAFGKNISMASQYPMPGSEINGLVSLELKVGDVEVKDYEVTLSNIRIQSAAGIDYPEDVTFTIHVSDVLTLDENSQVVPSATTATGKVKVIRTLKKDEWSTICLPINITATKLQTALGNYQLAELSSVESTKDGDAVQSINVVFTDVASTGRLVANHPYIIKVEDDIESFEVESVRVSDTPADLSVKSDLEYDEENDLDYYPWIFTGTHVAKTIVPKNSLFLSGNKFYYSAGKTKMKAFRGYFTFNDILSSLDGASSRVKFFVTDGDETTEIQIPELLNDGEYYNLNGVRVDTPSKGIYIKDGKKIVVR